MGDSNTTKVIKIVGDNKDILNKLHQITKAGTKTASKLGADLSKSIKSIQDGVGKLSKTEIFNKDGTEKATKSVDQFSKIIHQADGTMGKYTETTSKNAKGLTSVTKSYSEMAPKISAVTKAQSSLIGKSSQLATQLGSVADINQKFSKQLKGVGFASNIVARDIPKVSGNIKKMGAVVQTSDGKFLHLKETIKTTAQGIRTVDKSVKDVTKAYKKMGKSSQTASKQTKSFADNMGFLAKRAVTVIPIWLLLRTAMMSFIRLFKSSLKFLVDWEYQMTQIKIVGKDSAEAIDNMSSSLLNLATSLGISNQQMGEATKLFIQQGRSASEILPLLDATAKLSLLTGRNMVKSVEDMTAVLKAYSMEAKDAINVVDLITNVMLNNAITADDLASAYKQVASTASVMGVSLSGLTGYITAIKAETRDAGSKIGLALRTMFTRITTTSAEALQELTHIPLFLDDMGKSTTTASQRFRSLEKVLGEMSIWFESAGNADQARVAKLIGGVRRTNQAIVLFKNFNQVIKAQTDALLGLGKADQAIAQLTDTTKLRITSMANEWKEFIDIVGDTKVFKDALEFMQTQIQGLSARLDPDQAFFTGLTAELQKSANEAQRVAKFAENFTSLFSMAQNLSDQLGMAETVNQIDLVNDRTDILKDQIESFNRLNPDVKINITSDANALELASQLQSQLDKHVDLRVKSTLDFNRTQLQSQFISIGKELQDIITPASELKFANLGKIDPKILYRKFKGIDAIVDKISRGEFVQQDELNKITKWTAELELGADVTEGLTRKFKKLVSVQKERINLSSTESAVRDKITNRVDRQLKKSRSAKQVSEDLYKIQIKGIKEGKTKESILQSQLEILERQDQVLTDQLENTLKNIRKQLEQIRAEEEQSIFKVFIDDALERLKIGGALNSVILKRKSLLEKNAGIEISESERLSRKLQLEREINAEKRLQNNLSSESMKLYDISQKEGEDVAQKIGDVLSRKTDFNLFEKIGGKPLEVFKEQFPDRYKQQKAEEYFKNKGRGTFNLQEKDYLFPRSDVGTISKAQREVDGLPSRTEQVKSINQTNNISNTFNVSTNSEKDAVDNLAKAFDNPLIKQKLANLINGNKQSNTI